MLAAAGGGGGGGTAWMDMSIEEIYQLAHSVDLESYQSIVAGWAKSASLIADHMAIVRGYRNALESSWSPENSAASANYLDRIDDLLAHLSDTQRAAWVNKQSLSSAANVLQEARAALEPIYQQYLANKQQLAQFDAVAYNRRTPALILNADNTARLQQQLQLQAAQTMSTASSGLAQAQFQLTTPANYKAPRAVDQDESEKTTGSTFVAPLVPSVVPAARGGEAPSGGSHRSTPAPFPAGGGATVPPSVGNSPTGVQPVTSPPLTPHPGGGAITGGGVLTGVSQPPTLTPGTTGTLPPISSTPVPGLGGSTLPPPVVGGMFTPSAGGTLPSGSSGGPNSAGRLPAGSAGLPQSSAGRLPFSSAGRLPGEGVIGPVDGPEGPRNVAPGRVGPLSSERIVGGAPGGAKGGYRGGMQRVNPVGGVIGSTEPGASGGRGMPMGGSGVGAGGRGTPIGGSAGGAGGGGLGTGERMSSGRGFSGISAGERGTAGGGYAADGRRAAGNGALGRGVTEPIHGQMAGRRAEQRDESERRRWDPDNPWETEQGVDGIILPSVEQRINPGPVIGLT